MMIDMALFLSVPCIKILQCVPAINSHASCVTEAAAKVTAIASAGRWT